MKVSKIYLDMDGVLADFDRGVRELCYMEPFNQATRKPSQDDQMWEAIKKVDHFYDQLEPMPGALAMATSLHERFGDRVEILTGIPKPRREITTAAEDKIAWAHRMLWADLPVNITYAENKKDFCTGKDCILIDDFEKNIREWEAAGGTGLLFHNAEEINRFIQQQIEE